MQFFKYLYLLVCVFAELVTCHNSCRQCGGSKRITFARQVTRDEAVAFAKASIGACATGAELEIGEVESSDCTAPCTSWVHWPDQCGAYGHMACFNYVITVKVWRYCGNGGTVNLKSTQHCIGGLCAKTEELDLYCHKSVECHGECNCVQCGC